MLGFILKKWELKSGWVLVLAYVWGGGGTACVHVRVLLVMGKGRFEELKERLRVSRAQVCVGA